MTDIWLVRHGEAAAAFDQDTDPPLSDLGREQAATSAECLSRCVPDDAQLLTSPKLRAIQTGEPLAALRESTCREPLVVDSGAGGGTIRVEDPEAPGCPPRPPTRDSSVQG